MNTVLCYVKELNESFFVFVFDILKITVCYYIFILFLFSILIFHIGMTVEKLELCSYTTRSDLNGHILKRRMGCSQ